MTYDEAIELIDEHTDYGGSLDKHALAIAIATSDAVASQPKPLTDAQLDAAILEWFSYERDQDDFRARMRAAVIAATKEQP